jgi:hypothetical protein
MSDNHETPKPGEVGEHPLSVLLFSWMRTKLFKRVMLIGLGVLGLVLVGLEVALAYKPIKDITTVPGFYGVFGFLAFGLAVLSGWPLGKLLRRPEDYYEKRSGEAGRDR